MNAVCKGPFFTGGSGNVYDTASSTQVLKDTFPPLVAIAGPNSTDIAESFRAYIGSNEPLQTPTLAGLIISNATAADVRKVSSTTFSFLVTPNQDATGPITLQFEADSLLDLAGNKNENATNEWIISLTGTAATTTPVTSFPNIDLPVVTPTDCSTVSSVDVNDYTNPCYGRAPTSYASLGQSQTPDQSGQQGGGGGGSQIMQMLQGLLKGLTGAMGGGMTNAGGKGGMPGTCVCPGPLMGQPTIGLAGLAGPSGRFLETLNPGMGNYTGKVKVAPPGICGQMYNPKTGCINPMADSTGLPLIGEIPASPIFKWGF
jgi:hypothetical protein